MKVIFIFLFLFVVIGSAEAEYTVELKILGSCKNSNKIIKKIQTIEEKYKEGDVTKSVNEVSKKILKDCGDAKSIERLFQKQSKIFIEKGKIFSTIKKDCKDSLGIISNVDWVEKFTEYGSVQAFYTEATHQIGEKCKNPKSTLSLVKKFSTPHIKKGWELSFDKKVKSLKKYKKKGGKKCELGLNEISELKLAAKKTKRKLPSSLSSEVIERMREVEVSKFIVNLDDCFESYILHMSCANSVGVGLYGLTKGVKHRSIEKEAEKIFQKLDRNCSDPQDKRMIKALKEHMDEPIKDSMTLELYRLEGHLHAIKGKHDHRDVVKEMERIADKIQDNDWYQKIIRIKQSLPPHDQYKEHLKKRKTSCTNVDNTDGFVKKNQNQASTNACFSFGAANLMNYYLGLTSVSPIYLFTLSIAEGNAPWYPFERAWRSLKLKTDSVSSYHGGYVASPIEKALKRGKYCSTKDVMDMGPGAERLEALIKNTEVAGEEFMNLLEDYEDEKITKEVLKKKSEKIFEKISKYFPKATVKEFRSIGKKMKDTTFYRQRKFFSEFLLSQCKTPLPKEAKQLKVKSSYSFSNLVNIDFKELDQIVENGDIAALGLMSEPLLNGTVGSEWSPHIVTLTGRRWNSKKNRCEFRIVNSWGSPCEGIKNAEVECDEENGVLWISENLIQYYGNSLTTVKGSWRDKAKLDPNYEPYDPDL